MSLKSITKGILVGAISGGILGSIAGLLSKTNALDNLGFKSSLTDNTINIFIIGATLGAFIGGGIGHLMRLSSPQTKARKYLPDESNTQTAEQIINEPNKKATLQLHEEKLDISKEKIQTADVKVHKDVIQEERTFTVPVTHEELVIEKKVIDPDSPNKQSEYNEFIRIPLSEEQIEVTKHSVALNDVSIYKENLQGTKAIKESVKKEKLLIKTTGDTTIINKEVEP